MKKFLALLLSALLVLSCAACGAKEDTAKDAEPAPAAEQKPAEEKPVTNIAANVDGGLSMNVDRSTGKLSVKRMSLSKLFSGDEGVWTIFVYLCGSDLETKFAAATLDLQEMIDGAQNDNVRFVVETGGASTWQNEIVDAGNLERYVIQNGEMACVDQLPIAGMDDSQTLGDFLKWGVENYASEHMGVILWNHGGGSITGVCFDENNSDRSLSLRAVDEALFNVCEDMDRKFDFCGFDACLMSTLEAANVLASYADYMYASEETEPGCGWDYKSIGSLLAEDPGTDAVELGRTVCDTFYEGCKAIEDDYSCTLSVIDLSKLDALLVSFNDFAREMYEAADDSAVYADMVRSIGNAENFGGNNKSEGYTNMVDLAGLINSCSSYASNASATLSALNDAVVYSICGPMHEDAGGIALYYPLSVQGSEELSIFGDICPSPYYLSFVDRQNQGSVYGGDNEYDDDSWFDDDGLWSWGATDDLVGDDYWDYLEGYAPTGESPLISFAVEPAVDEESGYYWFQLDEETLDYTASVTGIVYQISDDGEDLITLGETYDINADWESGLFADDFDGYWLSLPDGQNLSIYVVSADENSIVYTSPVRINGEDTNLRLRQDANGVTIEGAWDGIDENGAAARDIIKLKAGDVIVPLYNATSIEGNEEFLYHGREYVFTGEPSINYSLMDSGYYMFLFSVNDIFGDYLLTNAVAFTVEDGSVYYEAA